MREPRLASAMAFVGSVLMVLHVLVGSAILAVAAIARGRPRRLEADWLILWAGFGVVLGVPMLALGNLSATLWTVGTVAIGIGTAWLLRPSVRTLRAGLWAGLIVTFVLLVALQAVAPHHWNTDPSDALADHVLTSLDGYESLSAIRHRSWTVPDNQTRATFHVDARLEDGSVGWSWATHGPVEVVPIGNVPTPHSRISFGASGDPYVQRSFDLGAPIAGERFRVTLELRADRAIDRAPCRGVWLQAFGEGGGSSCRAVEVGTAWTAVEHEWTAPDSATTHRIRVVLNEFDDYTIEVRSVRLFREGDGWEALAPLIDGWPSVRVRWGSGPNIAERTVAFDPSRDALPVEVVLERPDRRPASTLTATVVPTRDAVLGLGEAGVSTDVGAAPTAFALVRQSLWYGHPNLLAHGLATVIIVLVAIAGSRRDLWALVLAAPLLLWIPGSRAALVFTSAAVALNVLRHRRTTGPAAIAVAAVVTVAVVALAIAAWTGRTSFSSIAPFNQGERTERTAIWNFAVAAIGDHPLGGLTSVPTTFAERWAATQGPGEVVTHAHNVWLELGSAYGVPGLFAAVWLTAGLLVLAWRRAGARGAAMVLPILGLNLVDATLFHPAVLWTLTLGINALGSSEPRTTPPTRRAANPCTEPRRLQVPLGP